MLLRKRKQHNCLYILTGAKAPASRFIQRLKDATLVGFLVSPTFSNQISSSNLCNVEVGEFCTITTENVAEFEEVIQAAMEAAVEQISIIIDGISNS